MGGSYGLSPADNSIRSRYTYELRPVENWVAKNGIFDNFSGFNRSTKACIYKVRGDDGYLLRSCPVGVEPRDVIPHMLQPIFRDEHEGVVIEVLPWKKKRLMEPHHAALFTRDVNASGYNWTDSLELFEFTYEDPKKNKLLYVPIAVDPGEVTKDADDKNLPRCSANYPTLERQWEEQCKLVKQYPRLQQLLKGKMPDKLPETEIVQIRGRKR